MADTTSNSGEGIDWIEADVPWPVERGLEILTAANAEYELSLRDGLAPSVADSHARRALDLLWSALNWLEDTEYEDAVHEQLHETGRAVRQRFPRTCILTWTGERYEHRCPVRLAHKRFGFSPGFIIGKKICSICGQDATECEHLPTRKYKLIGGRGPDGKCTICHKADCVEHIEGNVYWERPSRHLTEIREMTELSLVSRPRQPDARIYGLPLENNEVLRRAAGTRFKLGDTLYCSMCLEPCPGFDYLDSDPRSKQKRST